MESVNAQFSTTNQDPFGSDDLSYFFEVFPTIMSDFTHQNFTQFDNGHDKIITYGITRRHAQLDGYSTWRNPLEEFEIMANHRLIAMTKIKYPISVLICGLVILSCATSAKSSPMNPPDNSKIQIIDTRFEFGLFEDNILSGPHSFDAVKPFESEYRFKCKTINYTILTQTKYREEERLQTRIISFKKNEQDLKTSKLQSINQDLKDNHLLGPFALRCSSRDDDHIHLTINQFYQEKDQFNYSFQNKNYTLNDTDFR